jgi:predicted tellurium resistance membrane protein TerC
LDTTAWSVGSTRPLQEDQMDSFMQPAFWAALGNIVLVNIVLSGDNAVVIALAARSLPANRQRKAIVFGSGAAIVMRVLLTAFAVELLT